MRNLVIIFLFALLAAGCASKVTTTGTATGTGKYNEDLSVWRPDVQDKKDSANAVSSNPERPRSNQYVVARYSVADQVDNVLDSIYSENLSRSAVDGYTIQVY